MVRSSTGCVLITPFRRSVHATAKKPSVSVGNLTVQKTDRFGRKFGGSKETLLVLERGCDSKKLLPKLVSLCIGFALALLQICFAPYVSFYSVGEHQLRRELLTYHDHHNQRNDTSLNGTVPIPPPQLRLFTSVPSLIP